jgi:hypothetical protein
MFEPLPAVGPWSLIPLSMSCASWEPFLDSASRAVDGLLVIIVGWVAYRLRGTSQAVQSTSQEVEATLIGVHRLLGRSESVPDAPDPKK